jgi:hypothetical protein
MRHHRLRRARNVLLQHEVHCLTEIQPQVDKLQTALMDSIPPVQVTGDVSAKSQAAAHVWKEFFDHTDLPRIQVVLSRFKNYTRDIVLRAASSESVWADVLDRLFDPLGLDLSKPSTDEPWNEKYKVHA